MRGVGWVSVITNVLLISDNVGTILLKNELLHIVCEN